MIDARRARADVSRHATGGAYGHSGPEGTLAVQDNDLVYQSGQQLGTLIKSRKVSPVDVARAFLDRAEALNPRLNAFITVTRDHALAAARTAEKEIMAGNYRGPLHGLPYAPRTFSPPKAS